MEYGTLANGLKWRAYTDIAVEKENIRLTLPCDVERDFDNVSSYFENPLFIPKDSMISGADIELMNGDRNFSDYKFEDKFEDDEAIVYLSTSKAAKLQRALKNAGYKKVSWFLL
jgi:uncharacterized protein (DUF169 family)